MLSQKSVKILAEIDSFRISLPNQYKNAKPQYYIQIESNSVSKERMRGKLQTIILLFLPIIAAFNYVVAHRLIDDAKIVDDPRMFQDFYFIVVSTAIFHFLWPITIILIFMGAFTDARFWRILTTLILFQTILIYGLACYMSLFLASQVYLRDIGVTTSNLEYYITWSAVSVGCLWFIFIVFLFLMVKHIYKHAQFTAVKIQQPTLVRV